MTSIAMAPDCLVLPARLSPRAVDRKRQVTQGVAAVSNRSQP